MHIENGVRISEAQTLGEMFKTAKHVTLAIEMPDRKASISKEMNVANKTSRTKFNSRPRESKSFPDKPKPPLPITRKLGRDKGKNRTRKSKKPFRLNIPIDNLVAVLKERYRVRDPAPLNPQNKGTQD